MKLRYEIWFDEKFEKVHIAILMLFSCVLLFLLAIIPGHFSNLCGDSITFIEAGKRLFGGNIDAIRTPIYPFLCHIAQCLFHSYFVYAIVAFQIGIYLASQAYLYKALSSISGKRSIAFIVTATFYSLQPCIASWCFDIMAESLSISCVVFLFHHISLLETDFKKRCLYSLLLLITMVFLKPIFLCFIPILFLFYFIPSVHKRFLTGCIVTLLLVISSYCLVYRASFGRFGLSYVSSFNRAVILTNLGKYNYYGQFKWIPYDMKYEAKGYNENNCYIWKWDVSTTEMNRCDSIYIANLPLFLKNRVATAYHTKNSLFPSPAEEGKFNNIYKRTSIPLSVFYILLICAIALQFYNYRTYRSSSPLPIVCTIAIVAIQFTAIWGAQAEYPRLMLPMYPIYIFLLVSSLSTLAHNANLEKIKNVF